VNGATSGAGEVPQFDRLLDLTLTLTVELGRCSLLVRDVLALGAGSIVALDRAAGAPVDLLVNERLVARGTIVAVDERFGVRITELLEPR
jgi:flagellar motor switch protein FliN/FliY